MTFASPPPTVPPADAWHNCAPVAFIDTLNDGAWGRRTAYISTWRPARDYCCHEHDAPRTSSQLPAYTPGGVAAFIGKRKLPATGLLGSSGRRTQSYATELNQQERHGCWVYPD